jgi:hypothetical protein
MTTTVFFVFFLGIVNIALCIVDTDIWVIVLDSKQSEFADLVARWKPLLPNARFNRLPAVDLNVRGRGLCLSVLSALTYDEKSSRRPTVIFESDARPFANVHYNSTFDVQFDRFDVYFLGGHHVTPRDNRRTRVHGWTPIRQLWGTFGTVVASHARRRVIDLMRQHCLVQRNAYAIDDLLSECFDAAIATPLLVDHPRRAFSETWKRHNFFAWAGSRRWWEFEPGWHVWGLHDSARGVADKTRSVIRGSATRHMTDTRYQFVGYI